MDGGTHTPQHQPMRLLSRSVRRLSCSGCARRRVGPGVAVPSDERARRASSRRRRQRWLTRHTASSGPPQWSAAPPARRGALALIDRALVEKAERVNVCLHLHPPSSPQPHQPLTGNTIVSGLARRHAWPCSRAPCVREARDEGHSVSAPPMISQPTRQGKIGTYLALGAVFSAPRSGAGGHVSLYPARAGTGTAPKGLPRQG
jgi:hypothetical protein